MLIGVGSFNQNLLANIKNIAQIDIAIILCKAKKFKRKARDIECIFKDCKILSFCFVARLYHFTIIVNFAKIKYR